MPQTLQGESPCAVSCPIRTASISGAHDGNVMCSARTYKPQLPCALHSGRSSLGGEQTWRLEQ
jgi:hypothetical protein